MGREFGQMSRRVGGEVGIVEKEQRLVGREDEDVSQAIREILEGEGITMRLSAECIRLAPHPDGVAVGVECASGDPETIGSHVLLAVGRRPNTDELGLDNAGVATDSRGYIQVDAFLATSLPGSSALGA